MRVVERRTIIKNAPRKPVSQITDRAKRYRANADDVRPPNPKRCAYCGSRKNVGVDHVDGIEDHGTPDNLVWACKRCNAIKANILKNARLGKRVRQYNKGAGKTTKKSMLQDYGNAIKVMRGVFPGNVSAAVDTIRRTPADVRSEYTRKTWKSRRALYGDSGRGGRFSEVPF